MNEPSVPIELKVAEQSLSGIRVTVPEIVALSVAMLAELRAARSALQRIVEGAGKNDLADEIERRMKDNSSLEDFSVFLAGHAAAIISALRVSVPTSAIEAASKVLGRVRD